MAYHKKTALIVLILATILLTGCGGMTRGRDTPPVSAQFVATGTEGIVMQFLPDQPPLKVYTGSPLTFIVEVRNRGTYTVPSAAFYLTGFDPTMLFLPPNQQTQQLEGKSQYNPEGGYTTVEFSSQTVTLPSSMPNYKPTFLLSACYDYQTIATPLVCVDPNPTVQTADKACQVQKVYSVGSQGAPVAVQSIESEARPSGMYFRIHIANVGGATGTLFKQEALQSCLGGLTYKDLNSLRYDVMISNRVLECEPKGELRLVNNAGVLFCKGEGIFTSSAAYQTPLNIRLYYAYKNSISKQVEIENIDFQR